MVGTSRLALIERMPSIEYASEAELLAACRRRDLRAFEQLYQTHSGRLKSIALHITGNRQDAEDAVQETFLKLYRVIESFEGQASDRHVALPHRDQRLLRSGAQTEAGEPGSARRPPCTG